MRIIFSLLALLSAAYPMQASALTCNLKTDTNVYSTPAISRPGYLQTITDPVFNTKITRITGNVGVAIPTIGGTWGNVVRHHYSKDQPWNADQTLIYLDTNSNGPPDLFLDGSTYQPLFSHTRPYQSDVRWHNTNPDVMIYVAGDSFGLWNVRTDVKTVTHSFAGYSELTFGGFEGNSTEDNTKILITGLNPSGASVGFAYDYVNGVKYPDISAASLGIPFSGGSISAKGNYLSFGDEDENTVITDLNGTILHTWTDQRPSHFDMAVDANGDEVAIGVSKQGADAGRVIKRRLSDGQVTVLTTGGWANTTSTRNLGLPGWAVSDFNMNESTWSPYFGEVDLINTSGGTVYRLAHHHNVGVDTEYESQTNSVASRDGKRVMFASSWGKSNWRPVSAYVVDITDNCSAPPPDTTPPSVSVTAPANGSTVSGTIAVNATASDNVGVAGVQFLVDGANFGAEDLNSPYSINLNTTTLANGAHTLAAKARDAAGNVTTSAPVTVTVNNTAPPANLITNPGFESSLTGWDTWANSTTITTAGNVYAGLRSLRSGKADGGVYQDVTAGVTAGQTYTLSFAAKMGVAGDQSAEIGIEFFDGNGDVMYDQHLVPTSTSYTPMSLDVTAPSGFVSAVVYVYKGTSTGYVFVDSFSLMLK